MNYIRNAIWILVWVAVLLFCAANWIPVTIAIWPGVLVDSKLPVLIVGALAVGALPMWIARRASNWSLTRRINGLQSELHQLRAAAAAATAPAADTAAVAAPLAADIPHHTPDTANAVEQRQ